MLGQSYFAARLSDIYEYSIIPYLCGECTSNEGNEYFWELCVDVSGNILFVLHSKDASAFFHSSEGPFGDSDKIQRIIGMSDDATWEIACTDIYALKCKGKLFREFTCFCHPKEIVLQRQEFNNSNFAKAYFSNFNFVRIEHRRKFNLKIDDKAYCFQMLENSDRLIELIETSRISNALLSTVRVPTSQTEAIQSEIKSIGWFLSLLSLNSISAPVIEYLYENEVVKIVIEEVAKKPYYRGYIIDDSIRESIPRAFSDSYQSYKTWQTKIDLNIVIKFLIGIIQQEFVEHKLALMLMAYDYLLLKFLLEQGLLLDKIGKNIEQKLNQTNRYLQCIPEKMRDATLRDSVRNPLFHQGDLPMLTLDEQVDFLHSYYDLLIKIILKVLNYTGNHKTVIPYNPIIL